VPEVKRKHAVDPLVLAIDIGSSATRARLYDAAACEIKGVNARVRHTMQGADDGTNVCDAAAILGEVEQVVERVLDKAGKLGGRIGGVAMDTFASSLVGVDAKGTPRTPVYTYADSRPAPQVAALRERFDERSVQQRTGARFHASYLPARFLWLKERQPQALNESKYWLSLGEFVYLHLLGQRAVSFSTAAWTGLLNRRGLAWDEDLLGALPIDPASLSPLHDTSEPLRGLSKTYARRWPALKNAAWFPAVADGFSSNVGSAALDGRTLALSLGTSGAVRALLERVPDVPEGLWCYAVDRRRSLLGGALNDGGRAIAWLRGVLALPPVDQLGAVITAPPSATTPVVLPFLTGERSPGWASQATASFSGMDLRSDAAAIFRGMLEGIAARLAAITVQVRSVSQEAAGIVASGGALEDLPAWLQIIADVTGLPCTLSGEGQTTMLGTAHIALDVLAPEVRRAEPLLAERFEPNSQHAAAYKAMVERVEDAYRRLIVQT